MQEVEWRVVKHVVVECGCKEFLILAGLRVADLDALHTVLVHRVCVHDFRALAQSTSFDDVSHRIRFMS